MYQIARGIDNYIFRYYITETIKDLNKIENNMRLYKVKKLYIFINIIIN